jgi:hypothetical protein
MFPPRYFLAPSSGLPSSGWDENDCYGFGDETAESDRAQAEPDRAQAGLAVDTIAGLFRLSSA